MTIGEAIDDVVVRACIQPREISEHRFALCVHAHIDAWQLQDTARSVFVLSGARQMDKAAFEKCLTAYWRKHCKAEAEVWEECPAGVALQVDEATGLLMRKQDGETVSISIGDYCFRVRATFTSQFEGLAIEQRTGGDGE